MPSDAAGAAGPSRMQVKARMPVSAELVQFANRLADASGEAIRPHFRKVAAQGKASEDRDYPDVVTEADLAAEREMRALVEAEWPAHGILGEEFGAVRLESDWVWVLDPVDGTRDFATGTMSWGTLIGLCFRGEPVLGVIDQPITRERWVGGRGHPTRYNGELLPSIAAAGMLRLGAARALVSGAGLSQAHKGYKAAATELVAATRTASFTMNAYTYGLIALGAAELGCEAPDAEAYDICAVIPIVEAVGGCVVHSGGGEEPAGAPFERIDLGRPKKRYSSLVCAGGRDAPLCVAGLAIVAPHLVRGRDDGVSGGAKL
eukprot:SAG31_NODE_1002_length_10448_cov_27.630399_10_plen_318_part_00